MSDIENTRSIFLSEADYYSVFVTDFGLQGWGGRRAAIEAWQLHVRIGHDLPPEEFANILAKYQSK
jgi:hypothetical protein